MDRRAMKIARFSQPVIVETQADARAHLDRKSPSIVVVRRSGRLRGVVFHCPCGCGETIAINLDTGTGPAWCIRFDSEGLTLLPSVWRPTGCRSHFIIWKGRVWWCSLEENTSDWPTELESEMENEWAGLRRRVRFPGPPGRDS